MKYIEYFKLILAIAFVTSATGIQGQTLFTNPDTTPNYRGYEHIEECWKAAERITAIDKSLTRDTIRWDTVSWHDRKELAKKTNFKDDNDKMRPESAIKAINLCLEKFNVDTVKILSGESVIRIIKILLIANRDQDAEPFTQRFLDSLRRESENNPDIAKRKKVRHEYKWWFSKVGSEYLIARPRHYDVANRYYTQLLSLYKNDGDSLYYSVDAASTLAAIADGMEDSVSAKSFRELALRFNDSTSEEERNQSPGAHPRLNLLAGFVIRDGREESLDSITVSNLAYNLWFANTVKRRIYGGKIVTKDDEEVQPKKLALSGDYYYVSDNLITPNAATQSKPTYTKKGLVPKGEFPIKNSINYIVSLPSFCHTETSPRYNIEDLQHKLSSSDGRCALHAVNLRALKKKFPEMEIIGLSNTYGTVGQLGPLTPDQEADTLARLFLEFHRLPVRLIVENTEVFRLAEPDGRRIDLETPNSQELGESVKSLGLVRLIDKEGYVLKLTGNSIYSDWFKRFYEILNNRPDKKQ